MGMEAAKANLVSLLTNAGSDLGATAKAYQQGVVAFIDAGGSSEDALVKAGVAVFNCSVPTAADANATASSDPPAMVIDFDYMNGFMKDTLLAYGVPEEEATI